MLTYQGGKCRAVAISGVDALDRRAKVVRTLEQLATRSVAGGEPLWYCDGIADMPEEIERPLQAYLDESHARVVAIVPLDEPRDEADDRPPRVIGALVAEQFQSFASDAELRERTAAATDHCAVALNNALTHSHLPLASVGRMLSRVRWLTQARQLPKTVLAAAAIAAVIAALALIPADFNIETKGELQPAVRRDVFASDDGVVSELLVDHGQAVKAARAGGHAAQAGAGSGIPPRRGRDSNGGEEAGGRAGRATGKRAGRFRRAAQRAPAAPPTKRN